MGIGILLSLYAALRLWGGHGKSACISVIVLALLINIPTYQMTLPSLDTLLVSRSLKQEFTKIGIQVPLNGAQKVYSPQFTEPSLVHGLGTDIVLGKPENLVTKADFDIDDILILDRSREMTEDFQNQISANLKNSNKCLDRISTIGGFNYSKGDEVTLEMLRISACVIKPEEISAEDLAAPNGPEG